MFLQHKAKFVIIRVYNLLRLMYEAVMWSETVGLRIRPV